jgi:hypothetical protein
MRSEIGLIGLMAGDRVCYQVGSALCAADIVTGRTIWERRNLPYPYSLEGDREYVLALCRYEPNDPRGLVLQSASGSQVFEGLFGFQGPLMGDWHGRRVLTTGYTPREVTRSMVDPVARKVDWSCSYSLPAWPISIDDEEFAVLDSDRMLHIHSAATGEEVFKFTFDNRLNSPQLGVRRSGNRYIVVRQTGVFRISPGERTPMAEGDGIWAIDRDTAKIAWSAPARAPQVLVDLPAQSPVLVLLRPVSRFESPRSTSLATFISILDAKTGKTVYEGREPTSADRINVRLDSDTHTVIVTTDKHRLEIMAKAAD